MIYTPYIDIIYCFLFLFLEFKIKKKLNLPKFGKLEKLS